MSENIDTKNHPTVKALVEHQERLEDSDAVFARRYIGVSAASWSLIRGGTYMAKDPTAMLDRCEAALQTLNDQAEQTGVAGEKAKIIDLSHVRAALNAVKGCYDEAQNRLVVFLAPSGGGKTTLTRKLKETYLGGAVCGEATETWRTSYFNAGVAIAEWLGITEQFTNPRTVEAAILDKLTITPRILAIDEGHYCGPQALNLLKLILNRTSSRVVLLAIPELWARMEGTAYEEVKQLRRRTYAKIVVPEVTIDACRKFLNARMQGYAGVNGDEKQVVAAVCEAANKFGLFDTLDRICSEVRKEAGKRDASFDLVKAAIKRVQELNS